YHFSRQFKVATGQPPHQYVIARRVERAQQLLQQDRDLSLAEIAACAGFSEQSHFSHHFKRLIGVTPVRVRTQAKHALGYGVAHASNRSSSCGKIVSCPIDSRRLGGVTTRWLRESARIP